MVHKGLKPKLWISIWLILSWLMETSNNIENKCPNYLKPAFIKGNVRFWGGAKICDLLTSGDVMFILTSKYTTFSERVNKNKHFDM